MDLATIALYASKINDIILSIFSAIYSGGDINDLPGSRSSQSNKLTPDDISYIPNGWVDAMNCKEKEKWLTTTHLELKAHIKNGT